MEIQLFGNRGDRGPSRRLLLVRLWLPKTENLVACSTEPPPALSSFPSHPLEIKWGTAFYCLNGLNFHILYLPRAELNLAQIAISPSRTTPEAGVVMIYPSGSSPKWAAGSGSEVLMVGHACPIFVCASPHVYFTGLTQPNSLVIISSNPRPVRSSPLSFLHLTNGCTVVFTASWRESSFRHSPLITSTTPHGRSQST